MIYGYLRVSSDEQDVNNQKIGVVELAEKNGWIINDWITDDGVSGTKEPEKRQLGVLIKLCKPGDTIICSELSRLGRKLLMVMSILEHCMKHKIMIYTVKDNYVLGDNIQSTVLAFAFSLASQIERDMIAMRTKEALVLRRREGVLLGYPRGTRKAQYVTDKDIQTMTELLNKGESLSEIGRKMKIHRLTVGYHLTRLGIYKGQLIGYELTYANERQITLTRRNCTEYGLYYKHIQDAVMLKKDLSYMGIVDAKPIYGDVSVQITDLYNISEHPDINYKDIESLILDNQTIPQIHERIGKKVDYDTLYDYIQNDTELSMKYRDRGHLKVKSKRVKY